MLVWSFVLEAIGVRDLLIRFFDICTAHRRTGRTCLLCCGCLILVAAVAVCGLPVSGFASGIDEGEET